MITFKLKEDINKFQEIEKYIQIYENNIYIGFLKYVEINKKSIYLRHIFIFEKYRNKGYGNKLINELFKLNKNIIGDIFYPKPIPFYEKNGFNVFKCVDGSYELSYELNNKIKIRKICWSLSFRRE